MIISNLFVVLAVLFSIYQDTPYKPNQEYEINFEYSFKQRTQEEDKVIRLNETQAQYMKRTSAEPLPFLALKIRLVKLLPEETKLKIIKDDKVTVFNKKITEGMEFTLNIGFSDDVKDQISGYKHEMTFYSAEKREVSRIVIQFDSEGNYFVNTEKRGKI